MPRCHGRRLLPLLTALLLAGATTAQREDFLVRTQQADGSWPVVQHGGRPDAALRVNALLLLAHLGDGSTWRRGPRRQQVQGSVRWLRTQADDLGRLGWRDDAAWPLDHAIGTFALCEELRVTRWHRGWGRDAVVAAVDALGEQLATASPAPTPELALWAEFCVHSLRRAAREFPSQGDVVRVVMTLHETADRLADALAKHPAAAPATPRDHAAQCLREAHAGRFWSGTDLPPGWPDDLRQDPLLSFYLQTAAYCRGPSAYRATQAQVKAQVVLTQVRQWRSEPEENLYGTWDPVGPFGEANGRFGATASHLLMLLVYYRYVELTVLGG